MSNNKQQYASERAAAAEVIMQQQSRSDHLRRGSIIGRQLMANIHDDDSCAAGSSGIQVDTFSYLPPQNLEQASSEALADALSSSLASIAAAGNQLRSRAAAAAVAANWRAAAAEESGSNNSSEERSSSSNQAGGVVVTASATTTSNDSSGGNGCSGQGSGFNNNSSSDNASNNGKSGGDVKASGRHHHRSNRKPPPPAHRGSSSSDGYGLPVPVDDQLPEKHAKVVAHLPPPPSTGSSTDASSDHEQRPEGSKAKKSAGASLLERHREPGFHTIRRTFKRFKSSGGATAKSSETDSSGDQKSPSKPKHHKSGIKRPASSLEVKSAPSKGKRRQRHAASPSNAAADRGSDNDDSGGNGSSSGSGTEGGYAGSASSNENAAQGESSSPSVSSSEESGRDGRKRVKGIKGAAASTSDPNRPMLSKKQDSSLSISSVIADFSSASSEGGTSESFAAAFRQSSSRSPSITSSSDEQDESSEGEKPVRKIQHKSSSSRKRSTPGWPPLPLQVSGGGEDSKMPALDRKPKARIKTDKSASRPLLEGKPPILSVGSDIMAHVLTFLEPPDILEVLTMPLSKDWITTFTRQAELWRVLCLLKPFKAQVEDDSNYSSDESTDSFPVANDPALRHSFGKFRLLYTNFVRCMRYLSRIKDDALHGRPPSVIDYGVGQQTSRHNIGANQSLRKFLARARGVVVGNRNSPAENSDISEDDDGMPEKQQEEAKESGGSSNGSGGRVARMPARVTATTAGSHNNKKKKRTRYGLSMLTQRLLGPAADGTPGNVELPWSCAIYSIVNWMVAFVDVEGIQTMCLKVLPFILEDEDQRITAQRAGLTDVVLRGMVMFPDSAPLHTAAFHTIVLLARPLGGREGMLFHTAMVNSSGIFSSAGGSQTGRNGIAVMLDSMRKFQTDEVLQAMSCWSLVNIALVPAQKEMLVSLGGIQVTANAMIEHPYNAEVQFRALFALINLVIPSVRVDANQQGEEATETVAVAESTEKEMQDEMVDQIVNLVVASMKNFCASEAILNRACLVLHNLSLTQEYHNALLWTPNCYQMLEWCMANYPRDQVLQQSAAGTLHRLQMTLSNDDTLRARFTASIQSQQQMSLEQAHREAVLLHEQHLASQQGSRGQG